MRSLRAIAAIVPIAAALVLSGGEGRASLTRQLEVRLLFPVSGYSPEQPFRRPSSLALDGGNRVLYVADPGEHRVVAFSLQGVPTLVLTAGPAFDPVAIAVDKEGRLLAADQGSDSVKVFDRQGKLVSELSLAAFGTPEPVKLGRIALDGDGKLYAVDQANCQVLVFDAERHLVLRFGERGDGEGKLKLPQGVAVDRFGYIYVSDALADAPIQVFDASGKYRKRLGRRGEGEDEHVLPAGIHMDRFDQLWVADTQRHGIIVYDRFGLPVRRFGEFGQIPGKLFHPVDVLVDGLGRVYVLESEGRRMQVFEFDGPLQRFEP